MQLYILLTETCNLHCPMCIRGHQHGNDLSLEMLQHIVNRGDLDGLDVVLTGGEPTQSPIVCEATRLVSRVAKTVCITTNGTDADRLCALQGIPNFSVQVSIDGDATVHDEIRGRGTFTKVTATLSALEEHEIPYVVSSVVGRKNRMAIFRLATWLETLKRMRYWNVSFEMPFGNAGLENMMSSQEWNLFVDELLEYARVKLRIKKLFPFELYDNHRAELMHLATKHRRLNCGSGRDKLYVYPDLSVYPCTCLQDHCVGNLTEKSLMEIQQSECMRAFLEYHVLPQTICASCDYLPFCNGGCIGMAVHYGGGMGMGDIRCPKIQAIQKMGRL